MSKVVPSKMLSDSLRVGADSFKEIQATRVRLLPVGVNSSTAYSPTSLNKISWRIPSYSNSFMDCSRSFISFTAKLTNATLINSAVFGNGLPVFERCVVKSSDGLVLSDVTDYNFLQRLFTITSAEEDYNVHKGVYGTDDPLIGVGNLMVPTDGGIVYTIQFNEGILSKELSSYLPLFMMNQGGFACDLDLYLAPASSALRAFGTPDAGLSYTINSPVFNICLLKMDSSLCAKFNEIACDPNEQITIPFTTFRNHVSTLTSKDNVVHIHESGTNLKRIWSVYTDVSQTLTGTVLPFVGSCKAAAGKKLVKYQYKIGTQHVYQEPVEESLNNNITLNYIKDAVWSQGKPMILSKINPTKTGTLFEDATSAMFMTVANMTYSPEEMKNIVQGISSTNPIELSVTLDQTPTVALLVHNFCELGFNLVVKNGRVTYEEQRPGSQYVY